MRSAKKVTSVNAMYGLGKFALEVHSEDAYLSFNAYKPTCSVDGPSRGHPVRGPRVPVPPWIVAFARGDNAGGIAGLDNQGATSKAYNRWVQFVGCYVAKWAEAFAHRVCACFYPGNGTVGGGGQAYPTGDTGRHQGPESGPSP